MVISSRTPEGRPGRCPVCDSSLEIEPSDPPGDAPCPRCGHLIWFTAEGADDAMVVRLTVETVEGSAIRQLVDALGDRPVGRIVLDFGRVRYINSAVLAGLINLKKSWRARGGKLALRGLHPEVREVFRITRLDQVFEIEA